MEEGALTVAEVRERTLLPCFVGKKSELRLADQLLEPAFDQTQDRRGVRIRLMDLRPALGKPLNDKLRRLLRARTAVECSARLRRCAPESRPTISRPATGGP